MKLEDAAKIVRMLEFGWSQKFPPETALIYVECLRSLPYESTNSGVQAMLRTDEFRPSVAALCKAGLGVPSSAVALSQAAAWLRYKEQMRFVNGSGHVPVRPETHRLVIESCGGLSIDTFAWQSKFTGMYETLVKDISIGLKELEA